MSSKKEKEISVSVSLRVSEDLFRKQLNTVNDMTDNMLINVKETIDNAINESILNVQSIFAPLAEELKSIIGSGELLGEQLNEVSVQIQELESNIIDSINGSIGSIEISQQVSTSDFNELLDRVLENINSEVSSLRELIINNLSNVIFQLLELNEKMDDISGFRSEIENLMEDINLSIGRFPLISQLQSIIENAINIGLEKGLGDFKEQLNQKINEIKGTLSYSGAISKVLTSSVTKIEEMEGETAGIFPSESIMSFFNMLKKTKSMEESTPIEERETIEQVVYPPLKEVVKNPGMVAGKENPTLVKILNSMDKLVSKINELEMKKSVGKASTWTANELIQWLVQEIRRKG